MGLSNVTNRSAALVGLVTLLALTANPGRLSAQRRRVDRTTAGPISVSATVRRLSAFIDLDYDDSSRVFGVITDLDHDGHPELIIRSAESLCGNAACDWAIIDGATLRAVGEFTAGTIYIEPAVRGYPTLHSLTSMSANAAEWETYEYKRGKYSVVSRQTFTEARLDSLTQALAGAPAPK